MREELNSFEDIDLFFKDCSTPDWDGYGARAVTELNCNLAKQVMAALPTKPTSLSVEPDGEFCFEWFRSLRSLFSISIADSGMLTYAGLFDGRPINGTVLFVDHIPEPIPTLCLLLIDGCFKE